MDSPNLITVTRPSEVLTSFRGPLLSFPIVKSINRETGILRRWIVFSQGKRSILVQYLFGKMLWDELNSFERLVFWHLNEVTNDLTIYLSLKALVLGVSKSELRRRLEAGTFLGLKFVSRQKYLTLKGRVNWFFLEETINLRKPIKFSGYTKHHKDKGHLGTEREYFISEILDPTNDVSEENILNYLTVGEFSLFGGVVFHPDETEKSKRFSTHGNKRPQNSGQKKSKKPKRSS